MEEQWYTYWNQTQEVSNVQQLDPTLQSVSGQINSTLDSLGISENTLDVLTTTVNRLMQSEQNYNKSVEDLVERVNITAVLSDGSK